MKKFKKIKKLVSIIICAMMVTVMFAGGVSAAEASTEATAAEETANVDSTEENIAAEVPAEPEIVHIADGEELPEYFYVVPKEKIQAKGEFSLEGLYAYIAIELKEHYLDPNNISLEEYQFYYNDIDLLLMRNMYDLSIQFDKFSFYLDKSYSAYSKDFFLDGDELVNSIMRGIFVYCETVGYEKENYFESESSIEEIFELTPDKITFSDEQLHYFDD